MGRSYEIPIAFSASVKVDPKGKRTVETVDFVRELALRNHHFTLREANIWIEHYQSTFKDISTQEGDRRTFMLYSHNRREV